MKTKVLLAGATGYLGQYIAKELIDQNYNTKLIVRDKSKLTFCQKNYDIVEAQVTQVDTLKGICKDIDVVISTIGITRQKDGLTYMDVDFQANMNLLDEAEKNGVKKFIYVSAFKGEELRHLKIGAAKELFADELKSSEMDYCIIRPNGFFSDMTEFIRMAQKGKVQLFGTGNYKINPIHGKDLAEVCVHAISSSEKTINVGGPDILDHNEIARMAFETINKNPNIKYIPNGSRKFILWMARTFSSSKTYGPMEFFFTVLATDMIAPTYGKYHLKDFYNEYIGKN